MRTRSCFWPYGDIHASSWIIMHIWPTSGLCRLFVHHDGNFVDASSEAYSHWGFDFCILQGNGGLFLRIQVARQSEGRHDARSIDGRNWKWSSSLRISICKSNVSGDSCSKERLGVHTLIAFLFFYPLFSYFLTGLHIKLRNGDGQRESSSWTL